MENIPLITPVSYTHLDVYKRQVKDLPAAVQEAITKNYAESTIKEAAVEANEDGTKTYKVVLTDEEGTESTVLFSESGEVLK